MSQYDLDSDRLFDECEYCGNFNFQCKCEEKENGEEADFETVLRED